MKNKSTDLDFNKFIKRIVILTVFLLLLALIISLIAKFNFGLVLFVLGMFVGTVGSYLGGPSPADLIRTPSVRLELEARRNGNPMLDKVIDRIKQSVPTYDFENVMLFAGWLAVIISLPFIIAIMA